MTDEKLIEEMARAMYERHQDPGVAWQALGSFWRTTYFEKATAALAAYRQCTGDDGK